MLLSCSMEKFLVPLSDPSKRGKALKGGAQKKLRDCKKVVRLEPGTTRMVFSLHTVLQAKEVLDNAGSSAEQASSAYHPIKSSWL